MRGREGGREEGSEGGWEIMMRCGKEEERGVVKKKDSRGVKAQGERVGIKI